MLNALSKKDYYFDVYRVSILNSLDERYGSTYRIRALRDVIRDAGHQVDYFESNASPFYRLFSAVRLALLSDYDFFLTQKFNPITLPGILAAKLRRKPVIVDWDDLDPGLQGTWFRKIIALACEAIGPKLVDNITTHSTDIARIATGKNCQASLVAQGFNGKIFQPKQIDRIEARKKWAFADQDFVVGHLCTLTYGGSMDLPAIFTSWSKVKDPQVKFLLIGGGPLEKQTHRLLNEFELTDRVKTTGLLGQSDVAVALRALDAGVIFMSNSTANRARVSFKTIEYLAMNVPVIGNVVGETEKRFGHFLHRCNPDTMPAMIEKLAAERPKMDSAAQIQEYDWTKTGQPLLRLLDRTHKKDPLCT